MGHSFSYLRKFQRISVEGVKKIIVCIENSSANYFFFLHKVSQNRKLVKLSSTQLKVCMGCFALDRKKYSSESESLEISSSLIVLSCASVVKGKSRNNYSIYKRPVGYRHLTSIIASLVNAHKL